jgi:phosphonoacetaldehyde hydrolase
MEPKIKAVVFDWAGTVVDYGSLAPVKAFEKVFREEGIHLTDEEIRKPMGLSKREHIRKLFEIPWVSNHWVETYNRKPSEEDIDVLYREFESTLFKILPDFSEPISGSVQVVDDLRRMGIKIGSTTGYTTEMIETVAKTAKTFGFEPDTVVTSDNFPGGRPYPWMCYQTAIDLQVYPMNRMVKVGDTVTDIQEGINAGMWTVAIVKGSNELGLSRQQVEEMDPVRLKELMEIVEENFYEAGADFVIDEIGGFVEVIEEIDKGSLIKDT